MSTTPHSTWLAEAQTTQVYRQRRPLLDEMVPRRGRLEDIIVAFHPMNAARWRAVVTFG